MKMLHLLSRLEKALLAGGRCVWSDEHQSADNKYVRTFLPETELSVDDSVPVQVCGDLLTDQIPSRAFQA